MITPIQPLGITPIKGIADTPAPKAVADPAVSAAPKAQKLDAQNSDLPDRKSHTTGGMKTSVPPYDLRLTVDKDPDTGEVVYKAINRLTGEVVSQMPNAEVLERKRHESVGAGTIIKTDV